METTTKSWLAFEVSVLNRLRFTSIALPISGEPDLGAYLKRLNKQVLANNFLPSLYAKSLAQIQNNNEKLSEADVNLILEDAYVPRYRLLNQTLKNWFGEADSWWFDNVRRNIEQISSPIKKAIALNIGMNTGDYALSFTDETRELRQPLSRVFKRLWSIQPEPFDNNQNNICSNKNSKNFVGEIGSDVMFLRIPQAQNNALKPALGLTAWREEWLRGGDYFWKDLESSQNSHLGMRTETKSQHLHLIEEVLSNAAHIKNWAIAYIENGFISTQDIAEIIGNVRRVDSVFTKDFTELCGAKAAIITA